MPQILQLESKAAEGRNNILYFFSALCWVQQRTEKRVYNKCLWEEQIVNILNCILDKIHFDDQKQNHQNKLGHTKWPRILWRPVEEKSWRCYPRFFCSTQSRPSEPIIFRKAEWSKILGERGRSQWGQRGRGWAKHPLVSLLSHLLRQFLTHPFSSLCRLPQCLRFTQIQFLFKTKKLISPSQVNKDHRLPRHYLLPLPLLPRTEFIIWVLDQYI